MRSRYARYAAALLLGVWVAAAVPVGTITNGQPDGTNHPYVGLAIQPIASMPGFFAVCSAVALSPTVVLTAAHCFDPAEPVLVTYKPAPPYSLSADFAEGSVTPDPSWCPGCGPGRALPDFHDVAVVTLTAPRDPGAFAVLPEPDLVDSLTKPHIDVVGYGANGFTRGGGRPEQILSLARYNAASLLVPTNDVRSFEFLKLTANPGQGKGGICFGDSGGPDLLAGTNTILGINTYVANRNCAGVTYSQRIDIADILAFIQSFL